MIPPSFLERRGIQMIYQKFATVFACIVALSFGAQAGAQADDASLSDLVAMSDPDLAEASGAKHRPKVKEIVVVGSKVVTDAVVGALPGKTRAVAGGISEALITTAGGVADDAIGRVKVHFPFGRAD
jgi:hypothetical protein